jgi:hypothetical protein
MGKHANYPKKMQEIKTITFRIKAIIEKEMRE